MQQPTNEVYVQPTPVQVATRNQGHDNQVSQVHVSVAEQKGWTEQAQRTP